MTKNCFLCNNLNWQLIYRLKTKQIYRCRHCGLFVSPPTKTAKYDNNYYSNSPYPHNPKVNDHYFLGKINHIKTLTGKNNPTILDIGCGWGEFLAVCHEQKIKYLGIDIAADAIKLCQAKGLNCRLIDAADLAKRQPRHYSAVTCFQVIEHLTNPFSLLDAIKKLLKPGGIVLLTTPNNDSPLRQIFRRRWSVYNTDSHYVFYNRSTLKQTLLRAGFANAQVKIDRFRFLSLGYILSRLKLKSLANLSIPVLTDPWGDLEASATMNHS